MRAILVSEPRRYDLADLPDPRCGPAEVVVRTAYCGICGTDLEILRGAMPEGYVRYPIVPGHEWTGTVEQIGGLVTSVTVGDRVSVEGYVHCGKCARCLAGDDNLCEAHQQIGMTHNGGLAQYVAAPAKSCHRVADHVGLDEALMVEPASTVVRGIGRANLRRGAKAAIIGCGPIGLIAARVLKLYDPAVMLGIDLAPAQETMARRAGINAFTGSQDPREIQELSGSDGWDIVVDCALGAKPLDLAFDIVRRGGTVVVIGGAPDAHRLQVPANAFVMRDLHVEGVFSYTAESWVRTLDLLASGNLRLGDLITHRAPLEEFGRALALVESRSEPIGKVAISFDAKT